MGILLICLVIGIIGFLLMRNASFFSTRHDIGGLFCIAGFVSATILTLIMIITFLGAKAEFPAYLHGAETYQALIDRMDESSISDHNALYIEVTEFNKQTLIHRRYANSFWTMWLVSPRWNDVPLVELPI